MRLNEIKPTAKVISGFPGVGKSSYVKKNKDVQDSDSSKFDKTEFPQNYIEHIKKCIADGKTVLVSSHKDVRDALIKEKINFTLVYPDKSLKDEYLKRYSERGSPESFNTLLDKNWNEWIDQIESISSKYVTKKKLKSGQFLEDVL